MRWALALGFLVAGFLHAEAPMDLDSPFTKIALIKGKTGETEKRKIQKARLIAGNLEMEKTEGGVALFPVQDVLAILPVLPQGDDKGTVDEIEAVMRLLQSVSPDLVSQAGLEGNQLEEWRQLKERVAENEKQKKEQERRRRNASSAREFQEWITEVGELRKPRAENELMDLKRSGESLAQKFPEQSDAISDALAALSQVQPKEKGEPLPDLRKLSEVQPRLIPDEFLGWSAGGILILSFFGLLFGVIFLSSSLTRFKEGAPLAGVLYGLVALGLFGGLIWTWLPVQFAGQHVAPRVDPKMEELGIYLKNRVKPVYFFPRKQFSFSGAEWKSWVVGFLPVSEEPAGFFKVKMKEGALWVNENTWIWQQPLTSFGIPLPLNLSFQGKISEFGEIDNPPISGVYLGRWLLPNSVAENFRNSASGIYQQGLSSAGLAGVRVDNDGKGMVLVSVPAAGKRPKYEPLKIETKKEAAYKREITAEELAQAFMENKGNEFQGKFVVVEGVVEKISSGAEYSGGPIASQGEGSLNPKTPVAKIKEDTFDVFYLHGADSYGYRKDPVLIKLVIKSPDVFVMDSYGDIYAGPRANTVKQNALIKKGYRAKFLNEGRVQSDQIKNNEIEIYGIEIGLNGEGIECFDPVTRSQK